MWRAHPFVGTGYGTYHVEFPAYASDELKRVFPQDQRIVNDAHNEYLQILAETGVAGFAVFLLLLASVYLPAARNLRRLAESDRILYAGLLTGALAILFQNFLSVDMRFIVSSVYVFLAVFSSARISRRASSISFTSCRYLPRLWTSSSIRCCGVGGVSVIRSPCRRR
jgi:O-antigen ligase